MRKQLSQNLKQHLKEGKVDLDKLDRRIYLSLPSNESHVGHPVGENSDSTSERMHSKVSEKIGELVEEGFTGIREVERRLEVFVNTQLCPELWKPCHTNRRYYPTRGVIRNKMYNAYIKRRLNMIDHEVVNQLLKERQDKNPEDSVLFRGCDGIDEMRLCALSGISVEEELEDHLKIRQKFAQQQMILVHQTSFQRHLLKRYGNHVCFLDPVYRTVKYPLPLFFLIIKTNVDYQVVATFVVQDENMESTREALELIKEWNPDWKPKVFMADNDSEEILALEQVFTDCKVFINDFHREQAWEKWLSQSTNQMIPYKEALIHHLHRLAKAATLEQFEKRFCDLERRDVWNDSYGKMFRTWFENAWLAVKERWVWCYKEESYTNVLTTNNTFEAQKKDFIHEQLVGIKYLSLGQMLKVVMEIYLPRIRDLYYELNADIQTGTSSKYANLPDVFRNRPRWVIDHISERITSSYEISWDDITVDSYKEGEFLVNCRRSDVEYKVQFGNSEKYPHCDCVDWTSTMLPCKHFVAVMRDIKDWSWSKFPESYRCSPYLTLDEIVNPKTTEEHEASTSKTDDVTESSEATVSVLDSSQFHELAFPKFNSRSKSSICRDLLNDINNMTYSLSDDDVINRLNASLDDVLADIKLSFVEDEIVIEQDEVETKPVKSEEKPKGLGKKSKRSSASTPSKVSPGGEGNEDEPPRKIAKPHENTTMSYGNETIEEQVLEEMNHMEILNIDYYRPAASDASAVDVSGEGNTGSIQESKGTIQEPRGDDARVQEDTTSVSQGDAYVIDQKKVDDVTVIEVKTPITLPKYEARLVQRHEMLTVDSINLAQSILHEMFPHLKGFQTVARGAVQAFLPVSGDFIQILHDGSLHWVCTANISLTGSKDPAAVNMYDSMNQGFIAKFTKQQLASFMCIQNAEMKIIMKSVQQQTSHVDCGVFAIAFATALALGQDPSKLRYDVPKMRPHLVECLKLKKMSPFPEMKPGSEIVLSKRKFYTVELFCSCRMPYEKPKSEADLMAQCGSCKEWFHQRCEKIALEIFKASGMNFLCALCLKRE
ncbi:uncharacterized protein LOC114532775 [Dendronephthya gigantea]|uniref:uncharacterized protein LOC114532775 n=1 Tax=Dendronephthya gigantea TaxID=151771 RepID=UPI00106BE232|nr:uncharacterized protein LOC114532775 [Dendronephthya gigantea]XP_028410163.1 uncharacterized protein LOC114532775 [Dendronephthya gigantea]